MKQVFLDNLPRNSKGIDWSNSVGSSVKFQYGNIVDFLIINEYDKDKQRINISWNKKHFSIKTTNFIYGKLGGLLNVKVKKESTFKYKVNDVLRNQNNGVLQITEQIKINTSELKRNIERKGYKYKCLLCQYTGQILESNLNKKQGCAVCAGRAVKIGKNDLWSTHPEIGNLLLCKDDGYKYSHKSNKKVNWKCPECNNIIYEKSIYMVTTNGLFCPKCSDNASYPNRFVFNFLNQLNKHYKIDFEAEKIFDWSNKKRYDFYIEKNNTIIEVHGEQHYNNCFSFNGSRTIEQEKKNDLYKMDLALKHNINNFITIDARKSCPKFLKNSLLSSQLSKMFDLSVIDWEDCDMQSVKSMVKFIGELWSECRDIRKIITKTKLSKSTIRKYLKKATELKWCDYNPEEELIKGRAKNSGVKQMKKIICLTTSEVFNSVREASIKYGVSHGNIISCCRLKRPYAGELSVTEKLIWMYYDDFLLVENKNIVKNKINEVKKIVEEKMIYCLTTNELFDNMKIASEKYKICLSNISACCRNKASSAGRHPKTGEKLKWAYYKDIKQYIANA